MHKILFLVSIIGLSSGIQRYCDVIIAGGSTAALAAALSSASEGAITCLLEPTDWIGGQLTAGGVPAIDFAWHKLTNNVTGFVLNVAKLDQLEENMTPNFARVIRNFNRTGGCWVSDYCFMPTELLVELQGLVEEVNNTLKVFYNTVVKSVTMTDNNTSISSLIAIQRTAKQGIPCRGYNIRTSQDVMDWYNPEPTDRYNKEIVEFSSGDPDNVAIFMDTTEWGNLLVVSQAPYLQGVDERYDGDTSGIGNDLCGQSIAIDFIQNMWPNITKEPPNPYPVDHPNYYSLDSYPWSTVWTYRRIFTHDPDQLWNAFPWDTTLQNWGYGNDYSFGYLFKSKTEALQNVLVGNWTGGIDVSVLNGAEMLSYGYHYWFKEQQPQMNVTMAKEAFGTCHGLSKMPYMRESRRSIGLDNFLITIANISGIPTLSKQTGDVFYDRVAIGAYDCDIHAIDNCVYPDYIQPITSMPNFIYPILPFYIPFRALTNKGINNLLVAGKTMAQSFLVNAATRLHPIEWSSGTAAGVIAAYMSQNGYNKTQDALEVIQVIQKKVNTYTPIQWTI